VSDDILAKMTRALAEEHDGATAVPEATRTRVVRALSEQRPRRSKWLLFGVPALTLLGGSTAFAAASGKLPRIVERAVAVFVNVEDEGEQAESPRQKPSGPQGSSAPSVVEQPELAEEQPDQKLELPIAVEHDTAARDGIAARDGTAARDDTAQLPTSARIEPPRAPAHQDESLDRYRTAHDAHFKEGNCAAAVQGYRRYLSEQPTGTFYLEAKYNLGVCLLRLGRTSEARTELTPFAQGKYGNYRKDRAQELLDALTAQVP
jgi:hypothetical protein